MTGSVIWKSGWYASRLHAVASETEFPEGRYGTVRSLCGQYVYAAPPTEWARRYVERGVPHCKRCERIVSQNAAADLRRKDTP